MVTLPIWPLAAQRLECTCQLAHLPVLVSMVSTRFDFSLIQGSFGVFAQVGLEWFVAALGVCGFRSGSEVAVG